MHTVYHARNHYVMREGLIKWNFVIVRRHPHSQRLIYTVMISKFWLIDTKSMENNIT